MVSTSLWLAGSTDEFYVNSFSLDITLDSIQTQLVWFNKYLEENLGCKTVDGNCRAADFDDALFWVGEIGVNDYAYSFGSSINGKICLLCIYMYERIYLLR